jgi:TolB-like protein
MKKVLLSSALAMGILATSVSAEDVVSRYKEKLVEKIPLRIIKSESSVGQINANVIFLADQLERNVDAKMMSQPVVITSFVNLDSMKSTSGLGRLISENLIHELQIRKWRVADVRLSKNILINELGEFSISRDVKKIRDQYRLGSIVTGTYTIAANTVIINARVINIETGLVLSTGQIAIPLGKVDTMLYNSVEPRIMKIKGD